MIIWYTRACFSAERTISSGWRGRSLRQGSLRLHPLALYFNSHTLRRISQRRASRAGSRLSPRRLPILNCEPAPIACPGPRCERLQIFVRNPNAINTCNKKQGEGASMPLASCNGRPWPASLNSRGICTYEIHNLSGFRMCTYIKTRGTSAANVSGAKVMAIRSFRASQSPSGVPHSRDPG